MKQKPPIEIIIFAGVLFLLCIVALAFLVCADCQYRNSLNRTDTVHIIEVNDYVKELRIGSDSYWLITHKYRIGDTSIYPRAWTEATTIIEYDELIRKMSKYKKMDKIINWLKALDNN